MPRNSNGTGWLRDPKLVVRIVLGILVAMNLVAAGLVLFPPGGSAEDLERQLSSLESQVQSRRAVLDRTREHAAAVQKGRAEGDRFLSDYFLASRNHMSELLTELEGAANESKIKPREHAYALEPVDGSDSLSMLTITAAYEGTYANLMHFVHEIDRSPRLLIIDSLNAAPQEGAGLLTVSMKMETFVREDANLPSVAQPTVTQPPVTQPPVAQPPGRQPPGRQPPAGGQSGNAASASVAAASGVRQ
jgi:type IV pilus assembly protein PilO